MTKRYLSLDVLRGLTVAFMIIVNNPGSWSNVFPPLRHASWDGCTPCDLVFPFFLFCVGASMAFSFAKYTSLTWSVTGKILKRGFLMYLVGLLLTAFPFYPASPAQELSVWENWLDWVSDLRLLGVLARIAMCYVVASLLVLWLRKTSRLIGCMVLLPVLHVGLLLAFSDSGAAFSPIGSLAQKLDLAVLGDSHMYHISYEGERIPFDPEGLLGVLTGTCTVILGYLTGMMIRTCENRHEAVCRLFCISAGSLLLGLALSLVIPINKALWSVSYVFYSAGWAMFILALLMYLIDIRGWKKLFFPFQALGMNALALFVLSGLIMKINWRFVQWDYAAVFSGNEAMSLLFAVLYMLLHLAVAIVMYKKKMFIKL